jgi:hypothetical protein
MTTSLPSALIAPPPASVALPVKTEPRMVSSDPVSALIAPPLDAIEKLAVLELNALSLISTTPPPTRIAAPKPSEVLPSNVHRSTFGQPL